MNLIKEAARKHSERKQFERAQRRIERTWRVTARKIENDQDEYILALNKELKQMRREMLEEGYLLWNSLMMKWELELRLSTPYPH